MREFERECEAGGVGSAVMQSVVAQMFGAKPITKQKPIKVGQDWRAMKAYMGTIAGQGEHG